jgi:hypothetical protein
MRRNGHYRGTYYYVVADKVVRPKSGGDPYVKRVVAGPYPQHIAEERVEDTLGKSDILRVDVRSSPHGTLAGATQEFKEKKWAQSKDLDDAITRMGHQL